MTDRVVIATSWHHSAVTRQFHELALRLVDHGSEVHLIDDRRHERGPDPGPVVLHRWPGEGRPGSVADVRWATKLLRDLQPSCAIANFAAVGPLGPAALLARVPRRMAWFHSSMSANRIDSHDGASLGWRDRLVLARRQAMHACYTDLVADSEGIAQEMREAFGRRGPTLHVQHNSVADGVHRDAAEVPGPDAPIVCAGRLDRTKGQDVLLAAMAQLDTRRPVVLLGDGAIRPELTQMAERLPMPVEIAGLVGIDEVRRRFAEAAVVVVPSRAEGFGLVAAEGMAAGIPVVASRAGGLAEIVRDGETGRLVPPGDPDALAEALTWVLEPTRNAAMGLAARADFLARFEVGAWAAAVEPLVVR